ncbi:MAG: hypothetical protein ACI9VR_000902 [Cognaticolwellia sp.]|jgi:hypothetical protein
MLLLLLACNACSPPQADPDPIDTGEPADSPVDSPVDTGDSGETADTADTGETGDSGDTGDTGEAPEWVDVVKGTCQAPEGLPDQPLNLSGSLKITQEKPGEFFVELIDLELQGDRIYGVGQGGLMVYDVSDASSPELLGVYPSSDGHSGIEARFHRVEPIADGIMAVTHREDGMSIVDVSDPENPELLYSDSNAGVEGLAYTRGRLFVSSREEGLFVYDVSDPSSPILVTTLAGLTNTWELAKGQGWLYAADSVQGIVPINVNDPDNPTMETAIPVDGRVLHTRYAQGRLLASLGSAGLAIYDTTVGDAPTLITTLSTSGSVLMADAKSDYLWASDNEGVSVWDFSDTSDPKPLGRQVSEQFALAIRAGSDGRAWVGDWNILGDWAADLSVSAAQLQLSGDEFYLDTEVGYVDLPVTNQGAAELNFGEFSHGGAGTLSMQASSLSLASGETGTLRVYTQDSVEGEHLLCLSNNDPSQPTLDIAIVVGAGNSHLGKSAPDFALTDLDGTEHRLSEQVGHPVVLSYFATW